MGPTFYQHLIEEENKLKKRLVAIQSRLDAILILKDDYQEEEIIDRQKSTKNPSGIIGLPTTTRCLQIVDHSIYMQNIGVIIIY